MTIACVVRMQFDASSRTITDQRSATILGGRRHSVAIGHHDADGRSLDDHIATRGPRAFIGPTEMRLYV